MKKIYQVLCTGLALILLTTACDTDVLDIKQRGVTGTDTYTTADDKGVEDMIAAIYSKVRGDGFSYFNMKTMSCYPSLVYELARMGGECGEYYQFSETSESATYLMVWSYYYTLCYWSNMIIANVPDNNVASEAVKSRVIAEARAVRATAMMQLVQLFGNPPLADHILDGSEGNTPATDSWAFIAKELSEAAEALPSKASVDGQSAIGGRITKEAAYAYLGKAYLWAKDYANAADVLYNKIIATGKYALIDDFNQLNSSASDYCPENIWEFDIVNVAGTELSQEGLFDVVQFGLATSNLNLPAAMYSEMCFGYGGTASTILGEFMAAHETTSGDTRSARYHGSIASYEDLLDERLYTYAGDKGIRMQVENCQGYFKIKNQTLAADVMGPMWMYHYSHKNTVYMRYAEVLLNYAEAVAQGGQAGALTGLEALNMVRRRAGLADAPSLDMNNATYGVKAERQAELYYEGARFIDLVRWGDAATVLADCGKMSYMFNGYKDGRNDVSQSPAEWNIIATPTVGKGFESGKNELFPIPAVDINNNPNLKQNPGW